MFTMSDRITQRWSPELAESIRTRTDPRIQHPTDIRPSPPTDVKLDRDGRFSFSETYVPKETLIRGNVEVSKIEQMRESLEKNQELLQVYQDREDALVLHYSNLLNELGRSSGNTADIAATSQRMYDELAALEKLKAPVERICEAVQKQLSKLIAAEDDNQSIGERSFVSSVKSDLDVMEPEYAIIPEESNLKHQALVKVFNLTMIPVVDPTSKKINYDRIQMIEFDGAPKLRLQLGGIQKCDLSAAIARRILGFIDSFQSFYQAHLTTDLFDELAWRYMGTALETVGLTERFYRTIVYPVYGNKNWSQVKICLSNIFRLPLIQADVVEKLYAVKPLPSEDGRTYGDRIKMLLKASGEDDRHPALISRILASLPDGGREIVINKFGSPESIKTVGELVHFMRSYPSILAGRHTDIHAWYLSKFGKDDTETLSGVTHNGTTLKASQGKPAKGNNKAQRSAPYRKPTTNASNDNVSDKLCTHHLCRRFGRKHLDAQCFRHHDMSRFEDVNKGKLKKLKDNKPLYNIESNLRK